MIESLIGGNANIIVILILAFVAWKTGDWSKLLELIGFKQPVKSASGNRAVKITRDHTLTIGDEQIGLTHKELSELAEECEACLEPTVKK